MSRADADPRNVLHEDDPSILVAGSSLISRSSSLWKGHLDVLGHRGQGLVDLVGSVYLELRLVALGNRVRFDVRLVSHSFTASFVKSFIVSSPCASCSVSGIFALSASRNTWRMSLPARSLTSMLGGHLYEFEKMEFRGISPEP